MFRRRYNEITLKKGYDVALLALIALLDELVWWLSSSQSGLTLSLERILGRFLLLMMVYSLVNQLTHRHGQSFVTAAILGSMPGMIFLQGILLSHLWSYGLLTGSIYFAIRALRRYGPQWKDMILTALFLAGGVLLGGIWPVFHYYLPFVIVSSITMRPLLRYKAASFPVAILITLVILCIPFVFHLSDLWPALSNQLSDWYDIPKHRMEWLLPQNWGSLRLFLIFKAGIWLFPASLAVGYALRSQRIHGDLTALVGFWWVVLAFVLIIIRPRNDQDNFLTFIIPLSFPLGAYLNLLKLRHQLHKRDRRLFRNILFLGILCYLLAVVNFILTMGVDLPNYRMLPLLVFLLLAIATMYNERRRYYLQKFYIQQTIACLLLMSFMLSLVLGS